MECSTRIERMEGMLELVLDILHRMANPASTLSVEEKAATIRKALESGDKQVLKATMQKINGG